MNTHYNIEQWAAATTSGRHVFNYNFRMTGNEIRGWELTKIATMEDESGFPEAVYLWQKKGSEGRELIRVGIVETDYWRNAQNQLLDRLHHSMRPAIPQGTGKLARLGDVCFVGKEQDADATVAAFFSRGNLSIAVSSVGEKPVDVSVVAKSLDKMLGEPPASEDVKRGLVEAETPSMVEVAANESVRLIERLPEKVVRSGWLKIITQDGELKRDGDVLIYVSAEGGAKSILRYRAVSE
jgi:hypothetical protein